MVYIIFKYLTMPSNEQKLLNKIRNNDETAFKVVYNCYYPKLFYFIMEFVLHADIAENIVQDTFVTFWNKRHELKEDSNISAYLYTVAKKNCLYRLREKRYQKKLFVTSVEQSELVLNLDALSTVDTSAFAFYEIDQIIKKTIEDLPPKCKKVFELSRFEGKKNREIAKELNVSVKAVEGHISKGLKIFRAALKDYLPLVVYLFMIR